MIIIKNKRCSKEKLLKDYPDAMIIDVTSKGEGDWRKLSPFYPHGGIPVPFMEGTTSMSVEGIWQGLKVFENYGIDRDSFRNATMRNIKRTTRKYGRCIGHRKGSGELLEYIEARKQIYVPSYFWMLEHRCGTQVAQLRRLSAERTVILLDYDTNEDIDDYRRPLSHASLIKRYVAAIKARAEGEE